MNRYLGIDVSKARLDVVLLHPKGQDSQHFTNTPAGFDKLHKWVVRRLAVAQLHVCMEATGRYSHAVAEYLFGAGYRVTTLSTISPPHLIKANVAPVHGRLPVSDFSPVIC